MLNEKSGALTLHGADFIRQSLREIEVAALNNTGWTLGMCRRLAEAQNAVQSHVNYLSRT